MASDEREEWYYGRDSWAVTVERLRRWVEIAVEGLSTDMLDQLAYRCAMYLNGQEEDRGRPDFKWLRRWKAEVNVDGPPEPGIATGPRNGRV